MPDKFADFDKMLSQAKENKIGFVIIHNPKVLGDDYREIVMNLNKLARYDVALRIVPPLERQSASRN